MVKKGLYAIMERIVGLGMAFNRLKKQVSKLTLLGIIVDVVFASVLSLPFAGIGIGINFNLLAYIPAFFIMIAYLAFLEYVLWKGRMA